MALLFAKQPTNVVAGAQMNTFQVAVVDAAGHAVPTDTRGVSLSFGAHPASAGFLGSISADAVAGYASSRPSGSTPRARDTPWWRWRTE